VHDPRIEHFFQFRAPHFVLLNDGDFVLLTNQATGNERAYCPATKDYDSHLIRGYKTNSPARTASYLWRHWSVGMLPQLDIGMLPQLDKR